MTSPYRRACASFLADLTPVTATCVGTSVQIAVDQQPAVARPIEGMSPFPRRPLGNSKIAPDTHALPTSRC